MNRFSSPPRIEDLPVQESPTCAQPGGCATVPEVLPGQLPHLEGLPYLWSVALSCNHPAVCRAAMQHLLRLHSNDEDDEAAATLIRWGSKDSLSTQMLFC